MLANIHSIRAGVSCCRMSLRSLRPQCLPITSESVSPVSVSGWELGKWNLILISLLKVTDDEWSLHDVPHTHNVGLLLQFRLNVGPESLPIPVSMAANRLRRWPNTRSKVGLLYTQRQHPSKHVPSTRYCFNVGPTSCWATAALYAGDALLLPLVEKPLPTR